MKRLIVSLAVIIPAVAEQLPAVKEQKKPAALCELPT